MEFWTDGWTPRVDDGRAVYVVATEHCDPRAGLRAASILAQPQHLRIVLLVAHVVPFGTELDDCGHDLRNIGSDYMRVAQAAGVDVDVRVCACRDAKHMFARLLISGARVVIAGRRGRWMHSPAERLAHTLAAEGHRVEFVDAAGAIPVEPPFRTFSGNLLPPLRRPRIR